VTGPQRRWSHVTYASFRNRAGGGGWHTGPSVGASSEDEQLVVQYAPTSVVPTTTMDDFIGAKEIAELPRRFEYLPGEDRGLFMQSVPAGKDATGRPGNVFTHAFIDHDLSQPLAATYPVNLYGSPDLKTPFRIASVDAVELDPELAEPRPGPLTDLAVAWTMVTTMLGDRSGALFRMQDVLLEGRATPVLTVRNANEAVYWLQALSSTLSPDEARRLLRFSTFERAQSLPAPLPGQAHPVLVVPQADLEALRRREGIVIIDPTDPATQQTAPGSTWSVLTKALLDSDLTPQQAVEMLGAAPGVGKFGDALAWLVERQPGRFGAEAVDAAQRHRATVKRPQAAPPRDPDLDLVRRVIADPLLVRGQQVWPDLTQRKGFEHERDTLADAAVEGIRALGTAPTEVLVGYLNFLLRTGLVPADYRRDQGFRDLFSGFHSFRGAPHLPLPSSAHPELRDLLVAADADRKREIHTRQLQVAQVTRALGADRSLQDITAWLRSTVAREALQSWRDEKVISRNARDFSHDLLRVYYTVCIHLSVEPFISGDRKKDEWLSIVLGDLVLQALQKGLSLRTQHSDGQPVTTREFVELGRRTAAEDIIPAGHHSVVLDKMMAQVEMHTKPDQLEGLSGREKQVLAAVARGIVSQMKEARRGEASE